MPRAQTLLLLLTAAVAIIGMMFVQPIAQDPRYHEFAGTSTLPNVLSNLPFLPVGLYGLWCWRRARWGDPIDRYPWLAVCIGSILIGLGSGYYHNAPDDHTLYWDRLPMTIGFMGIFAAIIGERLHSKAGLLLLAPLLIAGVGSVETWRQLDDLRFYALVQFYPAIAIPILMTFYPPRYDKTRALWAMCLFYVLAKVLEFADYPIYNATAHLVSGHTLKHLAASAALAFPLHALATRRPIVKSLEKQ